VRGIASGKIVVVAEQEAMKRAPALEGDGVWRAGSSAMLQPGRATDLALRHVHSIRAMQCPRVRRVRCPLRREAYAWLRQCSQRQRGVLRVATPGIVYKALNASVCKAQSTQVAGEYAAR